MATAQAVLDFKTVNETQFIRIDGEAYDIRHPDTLTLAQYKRVEAMGPQLGALLQRLDAGALSPDEEAELDRLLRIACATALDAPPDVQARLSDVQRLAVVHVFTQLRSTTAQQVGVMGASRSAGKTSSRNSNGSTAARRKVG